MKRLIVFSMLFTVLFAGSFASSAAARSGRTRYRSYSYGSRGGKKPASLNTHYFFGYKGVGGNRG